MYTSGALILTDDGGFIYKATHPKHEITKTYNATIKGKIDKEEIEKLKNGVDITISSNTYPNNTQNTKHFGNATEVFTTSKANVRILKYDQETNKTRIEIIIHEGKNRQVRKMLESLDKKVLSLHRSKIGKIDLQGLKIGEWRYLKPKEVQELMKSIEE